MGQLVNITNINSDVAATLGVSALTGFTRVVAPAGELTAGSVSTAYLCQTNDGVAPTVRIDAAAAVFAGGNTYHRVSFMVRCIKTDNEVGTAPSTGTLLDVTDDTGTFSYRARTRIAYTPPSAASPDLSRYTPSLGALCLYIDSPTGNYGTEGGFCHTESGNMFRNSAGSATTPSGGVYTPNFPTGQWMRWTFAFDKANKRCYHFINGHLCGFYSMNSAAATATTTWTVTFPAWAGFRWHLCEMSSWGDTSAANDTGLGAVTDDRNWRTWAVSPTFSEVAGSLTGTPAMGYITTTNITRTIVPYSLASGNRPLRERARYAIPTAATGTQTFAVFNCPIRFDENGYFNVVTNMRLGAASVNSVAQSWTFSGQFTGIFPSFNIAYSSGAYRMTDASGQELGSWAPNEMIQWTLTLSNSGVCYSTIVNQSKDTTATNPTSKVVALAASDAVPTTTFSFLGSFIGVGDGVTTAYAEMEAWEGYRTMGFLLTDSYTEAALSGTTAYNVSSFTTAYRATANRPSLLNIWDGAADCNAHGCMTAPMGPQYPRWAVSGSWGRSGKKLTDWATYNVGSLSYLRGAACIVVGGFVNDLAAATDATSAQTAADNLESAFVRVARMMLDQFGTFIWIRPTFPYYRPNLSYPASPLNGQYPYVAFHLAMAQVTDALKLLQRSHPRGSRLVVADAGSVDFSDGVHWGTDGTVPALVNAAAQVAPALGESYPEASTAAGSSQGNFSSGGSRRRKIVPIPA